MCACCKVQRQHLVLVRTRRGYSDGYTAHTSGEGGGALVPAPFIVSKASVSCLCLIGRLCRERGRERERGWACGKRTEGGAGACEHTDTSERAKKGNNRGDAEIWGTEDKRRGRKESSSVLLREGNAHPSCLVRPLVLLLSADLDLLLPTAFWRNTENWKMQEKVQERTAEMKRWLTCMMGLCVWRMLVCVSARPLWL